MFRGAEDVAQPHPFVSESGTILQLTQSDRRTSDTDVPDVAHRSTMYHLFGTVRILKYFSN